MLRSLSRRALMAALAGLSIASIGDYAIAAPPEPVTVFAAASLKNALDEVGAAFTAETGGSVKFSYAASGAIARQIEQSAPADVYVSADTDWMDYLQKRALIVERSRRDLLTNHLALIAPAKSTVRLSLRSGVRLAPALGPDGRLAVAGPDVPAGRYARASLTALGVFDSVKDRLAPAESVRAALAFVARGETPLGIVYDTDAKVEPAVRIVALFPDSSHPRIVYPIALVAASRSTRAPVFLRFVESPKASAIFRKYGFIALPSP
ncbi:MAG TPA: molybdate ABC transporter substrate-binding protein [Caulobacteraceae bacterium]|jgi:molybdate transport system substrate-binding protein